VATGTSREFFSAPQHFTLLTLLFCLTPFPFYPLRIPLLPCHARMQRPSPFFLAYFPISVPRNLGWGYSHLNRRFPPPPRVRSRVWSRARVVRVCTTHQLACMHAGVVTVCMTCMGALHADAVSVCTTRMHVVSECMTCIQS
jgi:hypothetical protein